MEGGVGTPCSAGDERDEVGKEDGRCNRGGVDTVGGICNAEEVLEVEGASDVEDTVVGENTDTSSHERHIVSNSSI
jgi:hypothetical protein